MQAWGFGDLRKQNRAESRARVCACAGAAESLHLHTYIQISTVSLHSGISVIVDGGERGDLTITRLLSEIEKEICFLLWGLEVC